MTDLEATQSELGAGTLFDGRLRIVELIGKGTTASVYKAIHLQLDSFVALRILNCAITDDSIARRFMREARAFSQLSHPNIVKLHSFGKSSCNRYYMVMEYIEGLTLAEVLLADGVQNEPIAVLYARQLAAALSEAHALGFIHRDLKPANIMVIHSTESLPIVKVVDFGLACLRSVTEQSTTVSQLVGTPDYMSPEQCNGEKADCRSDIYSIGCVLYELVCGKPPFSADSIFLILSKHRGETITAVPGAVSKEFKAIVLKCLRKEPDARYGSASELLEDLDKLPESRVPDEQTKGETTHKQKLLLMCVAPLLILIWMAFLLQYNRSAVTDTGFSSKKVTLTSITQPSERLSYLDELRDREPHDRALYYKNWLKRFQSRADLALPITEAHQRLSVAFHELGDWHAELQEQEIASSLFMNIYRAHQTGNTRFSKSEFSALLQYFAELSLSRFDYAQAEEFLRYRVRLHRNDPADTEDSVRSQFELAKLISDHGSVSESVSLLTQLEPYCKNIDSLWKFQYYEKFSEVCYRIGKRREALLYAEQCKALAEKHDPNGSVSKQSALLFEKLGQLDEAALIFVKASRRFKDAEALKCKLHAAVDYCLLRKFDAAKALCKPADMTVADTEILTLTGELTRLLPRHDIGEIKEFVSAIQTAVEANPDLAIVGWQQCYETNSLIGVGDTPDKSKCALSALSRATRAQCLSLPYILLASEMRSAQHEFEMVPILRRALNLIQPCDACEQIFQAALLNELSEDLIILACRSSTQPEREQYLLQAHQCVRDAYQLNVEQLDPIVNYRLSLCSRICSDLELCKNFSERSYGSLVNRNTQEVAVSMPVWFDAVLDEALTNSWGGRSRFEHAQMLLRHYERLMKNCANSSNANKSIQHMRTRLRLTREKLLLQTR